MKKVLPNVTSVATLDSTSDSDELDYLRNVKRLSALFHTGIGYLLSPNIARPQWRTVNELLSPGGFVRKYVDPIYLLGVGFGANSGRIMFDVDRYSVNHPSIDPRAFKRLLTTLDRIGLKNPVIIRSSNSGGIHIYYFLKRDVNTFRLASLASVALINNRFEIKKGQIELFPNCKQFDDPDSKYKTAFARHRLPLQPGGGGEILDRLGNPLMSGVNTSHETQLQAFLLMAQGSANGNDIDRIAAQLDPVYEIFRKNPKKYQYTHPADGESERVNEWRKNLETVINLGWTNFHQTNDLLGDFVEYGIVFRGLNEKHLFDWVFEAVTNAPGYNQFCRHRRDIEARIWYWIESKSRTGFYISYRGHPDRSIERAAFIAENKTSKSKPTSPAEAYTRARVQDVSTRMEQTVQIILSTIADIPSRIGDVIQLIQSVARQKFGKAFSNNTLHKPHYKYIWDRLLATKKVCDIVPVTTNKLIDMEYFPETGTESAFERCIFNVTDLPQTDVKPSIGETSHPISSLWSIRSSSQPPLAVNGANPDPDLDPNSKNIPPDPDPDLEPIQIQLSTADLFNKPAVDLDQLIDPHPNLQPIFSPNPIDLSLNPIKSHLYDLRVETEKGRYSTLSL